MSRLPSNLSSQHALSSRTDQTLHDLGENVVHGVVVWWFQSITGVTLQTVVRKENFRAEGLH